MWGRICLSLSVWPLYLFKLPWIWRGGDRGAGNCFPQTQTRPTTPQTPVLHCELVCLLLFSTPIPALLCTSAIAIEPLTTLAPLPHLQNLPLAHKHVASHRCLHPPTSWWTLPPPLCPNLSSFSHGGHGSPCKPLIRALSRFNLVNESWLGTSSGGQYKQFILLHSMSLGVWGRFVTSNAVSKPLHLIPTGSLSDITENLALTPL